MASRLTVHHNRELPLDRKLVIDVRYEDLSPEIYDQFNTARAEDSTGLLTEFCMIMKDKSVELRPTVAGMLMAS